jgi:LysM repeat protein
MKPQVLLSTLLKLFIAVALFFGALAFTPPVLALAACPNPVTVVQGDTLTKIAIRCGTTVSALLRANPNIKDRNKISPGQKIYLPGALIPGSGSTDAYIIQRGDTLSALAIRFKTTLAKLLELNKDITNPSLIYEGQRLQVPNAQPPEPSPGQTYTVQRGDTLARIAARFGTTVEVLLKLNPKITDRNKIFVGQKITLPSEVQIYTVVKGDTLRSIATRFNTTVQKLLDLNPSIRDPNLIFVGQVLRIR